MNKSGLVEFAAKDRHHQGRCVDKALSRNRRRRRSETVAKGESVTLVGFGTFKSAKRAARTGRN